MDERNKADILTEIDALTRAKSLAESGPALQALRSSDFCSRSHSPGSRRNLFTAQVPDLPSLGSWAIATWWTNRAVLIPFSFWFTFKFRRIRLRSLTTEWEDSYKLPKLWSPVLCGVSFPKLKKFNFNGDDTFHQTLDIMAFLQKHKRTLVSLELQDLSFTFEDGWKKILVMITAELELQNFDFRDF